MLTCCVGVFVKSTKTSEHSVWRVYCGTCLEMYDVWSATGSRNIRFTSQHHMAGCYIHLKIHLVHSHSSRLSIMVNERLPVGRCAFVSVSVWVHFPLKCKETHTHTHPKIDQHIIICSCRAAVVCNRAAFGQSSR